MQTHPTLTEFLLSYAENDSDKHDHDLHTILHTIAKVGLSVDHELRHIGLRNLQGASGSQNSHSETQQKLDLHANQLFKDALQQTGVVAGFGSEEDDTFVAFEPVHSKKTPETLVVIDPIDGSSNIDTGIAVGTIFSLYRRMGEAGPVTAEDFLQCGNRQIGAGYIIYGSSTLFVFSLGKGVHGFTLSPSSGEYFHSHPNMRFPARASMYSFNDSLQNKLNHADQALLRRFRHKETALTARYTGSLIADFHRNLIKGGIYVYPAHSEAEQGKLRLQYECNPLAYIAEQAGGAASDGKTPILQLQPEDLHQTCPLYIGPKAMMEEAVEILEMENNRRG